MKNIIFSFLFAVPILVGAQIKIDFVESPNNGLVLLSVESIDANWWISNKIDSMELKGIGETFFIDRLLEDGEIIEFEKPIAKNFNALIDKVKIGYNYNLDIIYYSKGKKYKLKVWEYLEEIPYLKKFFPTGEKRIGDG